MSKLLRYAASSDLAALFEIESICSGMPWSKGQFAEELENDFSHTIVCECEGRVVGFASFHIVADDAHLNELGVLPNYRRKGIARALMDEMFAVCKKQQCAVFSLEVRSRNEAAIALYNLYGLKQVGLRKNFYQNPQDDALVLLKELETNN